MNEPRTVAAFAPGSVSNVGCGFDTLGFALDARWGPRGLRLGDVVEARLVEGSGVCIERIAGADLPIDPQRNTAGVAAETVLGHAGETKRGVGLRIDKNMPLCSGLGSSAASAAAAALAVNSLLGDPLDWTELLRCAIAGEAVASGCVHGDNVAPSLLGGFVLVRRAEPDPDVVSLPTPTGLACALVRPHLAIDTHEARSALPSSIALGVAVRQWANLGALVAALHQGDLALLSRTLEDHVAEPVRSALVPGFEDARRAALRAGALGCSLSGSGPSLFALCAQAQRAARVAEAMAAALRDHNVNCDQLVSPVGAAGARLLEEAPCAS